MVEIPFIQVVYLRLRISVRELIFLYQRIEIFPPRIHQDDSVDGHGLLQQPVQQREQPLIGLIYGNDDIDLQVNYPLLS